MKKVHHALNNIADKLQPYDQVMARYVRKSARKSSQEIADDLTFFGGAGSLMDQGLISQDKSVRRDFEISLVNLGKALIENGAKNERMSFWMSAFDRGYNENV